jgi:hypothetical protein
VGRRASNHRHGCDRAPVMDISIWSRMSIVVPNRG